MPTTTGRRIYTFIERVVFNPIGLLLIIGIIVVVVNLLIGVSPDTPKRLKANDSTVYEDIVKH